MGTIYETQFTLLRRLPPSGIATNNELMDYLMRRNKKKAEQMTFFRAILQNLSDGILFLSSHGIIETINPAISSTFKYSTERLVGQHFGLLFSEQDASKIEEKFTLFLENPSTPTFEEHFLLFDEDDQQIPCHIILMFLHESFVLITRNESEMIRQQKEIEEVKVNYEKLFYQIIPKEVSLIAPVEGEISFSVDSASIIFISIVSFSTFSLKLSPEELMNYLSSLFGEFDQKLATYPTITKIKIIGETYMCASGLFQHESLDENHAEQAVIFSLETLQIVEELNEKMVDKLNEKLVIQIGIHTGGPLIGGIFGSERPDFDIIGESINFASKLNSSGVPSKIHISEDTKKFILTTPPDCEIESRGKIQLEELGLVETFLIKPVSHHSAPQASRTSLTSFDSIDFVVSINQN